MADKEKSSAAVYVSWGTFKNALDTLSQGIPPNRIDKTVFPGMAWALQGQLFAGMKFLGLTDDDGRPTPHLEALATRDEEKRKGRLREILESRYTHLFALDLKKTTPGELAETMSSLYSVTGETRDKAVRFFLSAAEYAGIPLSPLLSTSKRAGGVNGTGRKRRTKVKIPYMTGEAERTERPSGGTSRTVELKSGGALTLSASLDLFALIPSDRKFVFDLIDKLEEYERRSGVPETSDGGHSSDSDKCGKSEVQ